MLDAVRRTKWGYSVDAAAPLVRRILASPRLDLRGYSAHLGRFTDAPDAFASVAEQVGQDVHRLHGMTGFWPAVLDLGGGWPRQREPESRGSGMNPHPVEAYAEAACAALRRGLDAGPLPLPVLWLEPGRYLVGNAVTLLATVGATKRDLGHAWLNVDASTNSLMRVETSGAWHHILPATQMDAPYDQVVDVVGSTCIPSVLGGGRAFPPMAPGEVIAVLDAGMYAEVLGNQFNALTRPASVMLSGRDAHIVRRRETIADIFAHHRVPSHLAPAAWKESTA
jgi:diaminopimelate decarboxylase